MKYRITNKDSGEVKEKTGGSLTGVLKELGWNSDNCVCELLAEDGPGGDVAVADKLQRGRRKKEEEPDVHPVVEAEKPAPKKRGRPAKEKAPEEITTRELVEGAPGGVSVDSELEAADVHKIVGEPSEAEKVALGHKTKIEEMVVQAEVMFLQIGQLLFGSRDKGEWALLHYETWKDYIEDLRLPMTSSYSWATRLSNIYEYMVNKMGLSPELLSRIGVAKLTRLLPAARQGKLTPELLEKAVELSDLDLRLELGHSVGGSGGDGDKPDMVVCPRCGGQFDAKKAARVE